MTRTGVALGVCLVALVGCGKESGPSPIASATASPPPVVIPLPPTPPAPFEGEIVLSIQDEAATKVPTSITFGIKGDRVRYAPGAAKVRAIGDTAGQHAYAINDMQKAYADFDTTIPTDKTKVPPPAKIDKTTKSEKIVGLDCDDWSIDDGTEKVDVCVAKGIAFFDLAPNPKPGGTEPNWAAALTKEKAFPLRVIMHDKAGKEQYRAEASAIARKKLDDSMFQLPTGFKKGDLSTDVKTASLP
jgi:hypothetical protein